MKKQVYISADYDENDGDRNVVNELNKWGQDDQHKVDFVDMSKVKSGSVSEEPDCRICDLKAEFNRQINASSFVIFVVGNKTKDRTAGSECTRAQIDYQFGCMCTPYKENCNGKKYCKVAATCQAGKDDDFGNINPYSYLQHEFEQAKKKGKKIIILYNSTRNQSDWLPSYMNGYETKAYPFWTFNTYNEKVGNYLLIKTVLGYE